MCVGRTLFDTLPCNKDVLLSGSFHFLAIFQPPKAYFHIYQFGEYVYFQSSLLLIDLLFSSHPRDQRSHIKWLRFCYNDFWWQADAHWCIPVMDGWWSSFILFVSCCQTWGNNTLQQYLLKSLPVGLKITVHAFLLHWYKCCTFSGLLGNPQL